MTNYKLNTYGWEGEFVGKEISNEQLEKIKQLMVDKNYESLAQLRWELDELDMDIYYGDLFHLSKGLDNQTMFFEVEDEDGNIVSEFGIELIGNIEDYKEDFDDYHSVDAYPKDGQNIYVSIDEFKGGITTMNFESEGTPTAKDFAVSFGSVETPDGDWDFIDKIYFRGQELEVWDHLDNTGKGANVTIYLSDGSKIE